jgi:hypothetical protein
MSMLKATPTPPRDNNLEQPPSLDSARQLLRDEEPKVDAALKSFATWLVAAQPQAAHATEDDDAALITWTLPDALVYTRLLSKAINAYIVPISASSSGSALPWDDTELVAQVWNEIAAVPGGKVTKAVGRTCLRHVWPDLQDAWQSNPQTKSRQGLAFGTAFGQLLEADPDEADDNVLAAAYLVWATRQQQVDEFARRAAQRQKLAVQRVQDAQAELQAAVSSPTIEELPDDTPLLPPILEDLLDETPSPALQELADDTVGEDDKTSPA